MSMAGASVVYTATGSRLGVYFLAMSVEPPDQITTNTDISRPSPDKTR